MDNINVQPNERRQYFRIKDQIGLKVSYHTELPAHFDFQRHQQQTAPDEFSLMNQLRQINDDFLPVLSQLHPTNRLVGEALHHLNEKMDLLGQYLMCQRLAKNYPLQTVSLSAGGLSFEYFQAIPCGHYLKLELVIYNLLAAISCIGEVVSCVAKTEADNRYQISVQYSIIDENDRDLLAKRVAQAQSQQLRQARSTRFKDQ